MITIGEQKITVDWKNIPWPELEQRVFKLQTRIYKASQNGDVKTVRQLQKTLMRSWSAKCIAVRRVTQDNQGKKTAGIDGIKSLNPEKRLALVDELTLFRKPKPTRRIWIPKAGSLEMRPLGIPTMHDRALQALIKLVLEPEWEAKFEPNSYGFRPGRSTHDATAAIFNAIRRKPKFVLDADISKCFDKIDHQALLTKLNTFPVLRRQINNWLKAGVMDGENLYPSFEGTPQGGIISPLLANVALHGLENWLKNLPLTLLVCDKKEAIGEIHFVRYADDFVLMHENIQVVEACKESINGWLSNIGLELNATKTKITHTLHPYQESVGFNFLGFSIRQYSKKINPTNLSDAGNPFKTLIRPASGNVKRHYKQVAQLINRFRSCNQAILINNLNPIIRGWSVYYSRVVSKKCFSKLDYLLFQKLSAWSARRHSTKSNYWVREKYWQIEKGKCWKFVAKFNNSIIQLVQHAETPIVRHIKVKQNRSPYDGDWIYWSTRLGRSPLKNNRVTMLLKRQKGRCRYCNLYFATKDIMEVDHIIPKVQGGKDVHINLQLLHRHCHDKKTVNDKVVCS